MNPSQTPQEAAGVFVFQAQTLRDFGRALLVGLQVPEEHARIVADSLVASNLRGIDSHGLQMLVTYIGQLRAGGAIAGETGRVFSELGACLVYDGRQALGQVIADRATDHVVRLAKTYGMGMVVARNANHFGAAAWWGQKITRAGYIGMVMCNASPAVPPWQGKTPTFGTNPFCVAVPGEGKGTWLLDMATSTVALGKLTHAGHFHQPKIPEWWGFLDADGRPTTDRTAAEKGLPTPFGRYKGSGIAMMVEILSAGLGGGPMTLEVPIARVGSEPLLIAHTYIAFDPARFIGFDTFQHRITHLKDMVKSSEPAPGYEEVLVAGEPEWREEERRQKDGVPLPIPLWERLAQIASELNVAVPKSDPR